MPVIDTDALIADRVAAIREYHTATGISRAEIDVSGGVDSATLLQLVCRALGPANVTAVYTGIHSSPESLDRARAAAEACSVPLIEVELTEFFAGITEHLLEASAAAGLDHAAIRANIERDPTVLGSFRSCLRAPIGRALNRMLQGGIRHGTGNECEDRFLRFFQKGGDGEVDSNPIAMLSKGEVFQLARALGVPSSILAAVPSPDLHGIGAAHSDEAELLETHGVRWTYSKVMVTTGEYTFVGSIERMSRLLDASGVEAVLFGANEPTDAQLDDLAKTALATTFAGFEAEEVLQLLASARDVERTTRHKTSSNCPTLGDRAALLAAGVLTDDLPEA